jgi:hypothetical protein
MLAHGFGNDGAEMLKKIRELCPEKIEQFEGELKASQHREAVKQQRKERLQQINNSKAHGEEERLQDAKRKKKNASREGQRTIRWADQSASLHCARQVTSSEAASLSPAVSASEPAAVGPSPAPQPSAASTFVESCSSSLHHSEQNRLICCPRSICILSASLALVLYLSYLASLIQPTIHPSLP